MCGKTVRLLEGTVNGFAEDNCFLLSAAPIRSILDGDQGVHTLIWVTCEQYTGAFACGSPACIISRRGETI